MSETNNTFEDILYKSTPEIAKLARKIRALILDVAPDAVEVISVKDRVAGYGSSAKKRSQLVYIALPQGWARLGFYFGGELPDPARLLEGEGKRLRHIKIRSEQDLARPGVRELVSLAMNRGS